MPFVKKTPKDDTKTAAPPTKVVARPATTGLSAKEVAERKALSAKRAALAKAAIQKKTDHKPIEINKSAMSHVPSGSFLIDHMIGGILAEDGKAAVCPGYPRRYITEVFGQEASGKTTAALQAIAEVQKRGGLAMFLDFERALNQRYARSIGVSFDPNQLLHYEPADMETGWTHIFFGIRAGVDLIVVDSVAAMVPRSENDKDPGDPAAIGAQARNLSNMLPKVGSWLHKKELSGNPEGTALMLINQIRSTIGGMGRGDNESTSGGKALKFYDYLRIKFTRIRSESVKRKDRLTGKDKNYPYGNVTQVKIVKSKVDGNSGFTSDIFIRYNHGIDNYYSLIEAGAATKVISKGGASYGYGGEKFVGKDKMRKWLLDNPTMFEEIKGKVLNAVRDNVDVPDDLDEDDELLSGFDDIAPELEPEAATVEPEDVENEDLDIADSEGQSEEATV